MTVWPAGRPRGLRPVAVLVAATGLVLSACASADDPARPVTEVRGAATGSTAPPGPPSPAPTGPAARRAEAHGAEVYGAERLDGAADAAAVADACVAHVLAGLSLRQRVGQLFVAGVPSGRAGRAAALDAASDVHAGGAIMMGRHDRGVAGLRPVTRGVGRRLAARADGVRPFVAADQEGGQVQPLRGTGFTRIPSALTQGRLSPAALRARWRDDWAPDLRRAGVTVNFAPVADVVPASLGTRNAPIGRHRRQFGATPGQVAPRVAAAVHGMRDARVMATAKHFPGLGRVRGNTDVTAGVTDRTTRADDASLRPFRAAVDAGATFVMLSSATYPRIDRHHEAVFSPVVVRLLRERVGFRGLVVSDDLGVAAQVAGLRPAQRALRFLAAGGQVVVVVGPPSTVRAMARGVTARAADSRVVRARVTAAARAVLRVKYAHGLVPASACGR